MKKTFGITIIILVVIFAGDLWRARYLTSPENVVTLCKNNNLDEVYSKAQKIETNLSSYSSSTKELVGQSTEGGEQTDYVEAGKRILTKQTYFGETGKSEVEYYFEDNSIFYIKKNNTEYLLPLTEDPSAKTKKIDEKDFLLNQDKVLCSWYMNKLPQKSNPDEQDLINYLISTI